mgnify:CR=1 FL=1
MVVFVAEEGVGERAQHRDQAVCQVIGHAGGWVVESSAQLLEILFGNSGALDGARVAERVVTAPTRK